ncbi:MAG TPA: hypothetical protein VNT99_06285, partial [Methylomirabilota bacterium]|nr:hypothetical protein [Methylomirabilota bacterium]
IGIERDGNGGYFIRGHGSAGFTYQLLRAPSVTGPWTTNVTTTALSSGLFEFHETNAPPGPAFYRVTQ